MPRSDAAQIWESCREEALMMDNDMENGGAAFVDSFQRDGFFH
jgi:hypothetical protein